MKMSNGIFLRKDSHMETQAKEKKKWKTPHTFVILVVIIIIAAAATYIVPAGEFARYKDAATGKTLVEAGSYHRIESAGVDLVWLIKWVGVAGKHRVAGAIQNSDGIA